jgi:hypothetical protein
LAVLTDHDGEQMFAPQQESLTRFLAGLATAWHDGEVRPTHGYVQRPRRHWRTRREPLEAAWPEITGWLAANPDSTGRVLLQRLQAEHPHDYAPGHLRTLQRRLKAWRSQRTHELVFGVSDRDGISA